MAQGTIVAARANVGKLRQELKIHAAYQWALFMRSAQDRVLDFSAFEEESPKEYGGSAVGQSEFLSCTVPALKQVEQYYSPLKGL